MFQLASNPIIDEGAAGVLLSLKEAGYVADQSMKLRRFNARVLAFLKDNPRRLRRRTQVVGRIVFAGESCIPGEHVHTFSSAIRGDEDDRPDQPGEPRAAERRLGSPLGVVLN